MNDTPVYVQHYCLVISTDAQLNYVMELQSTTQNGQTALTAASFYGHYKVAELLLEAGANPDLQDKVRTGRDSGVYSTLSNGDGTSCIL